jgi:phage terminase small subunit
MPRKKWVEAVDGPRPLTAKQRRFVEEYVVDMNALRASQRAGYSHRSSSAVNVLRLPHVATAVEAALAEKKARSAVNADQVLAELGRIALSNVMDLMVRREDGGLDFDLDRLTRETGAAVSRLRVEYYPDQSQGRRIKRVSVALAEKTPVLREIAKHLGMYREKVDVTVGKAEPVYVVTGVPRHRDRLADPNRNRGRIRVIDPSEVEAFKRGEGIWARGDG